MSNRRVIQVEEKVPFRLLAPLSIQHMFAMFGASVLVPFIFGINPAIVLFMNGIGTLLFILITKGKAPAYLGSSFAFLAPAGVIISEWGYDYALGGFVAVGFLGCVLAFIIYKFGTKWIDVVLPPAAMGPVVALIGLELASSAAGTGLIVPTAEVPVVLPANVIVFLVTLGVAVLGGVLFRKFLSVIPILIAIVAGYIAALITGVITPEQLSAAISQPIFSLPNFQMAKFDINAILIMLPVLLVIASEHIGHQLVTSKIVGRDLLKDPGLHRSLFADNFSTMISGLIGSVPTTTYGENIGVMAMTKVYSVRVIGGAAILSIICSFVGHAGRADPDDPRTGYRRNFFPALRHDRNVRHQDTGGQQGGLWQKPQSDFDLGDFCRRTVGRISVSRQCVTLGHDACGGCGHGSLAPVLPV